MRQSYDEQLPAFPYSLHLEPQEFVCAPSKRLSGSLTLRLHQPMNLLAQPAITNADEPPWLHEANARCQVRGTEQPLNQAFIEWIGKEMPHVPAQSQHAIDGC